MAVLAIASRGATSVTSQFWKLSDFGRMIVLAALLHVIVLLGFWLAPNQEVKQIPVRSLSITLGEDLSRFSPPVPTVAAPPAAAPQPPAAKPKAPAKPVPAPKAKAKSSEITFKKKVSIPAEAPAAERRWPKEQAIAAPTTAVVTSEPSHFVRAPIAASAGSGQAAGTASDAGGETPAQIKARYEQTMSGWLQRHRVVPEMARSLGQHGTPVLRVRIVRSGAVKYFAIERSSGYEMIDQAAMDMVRRANPFPAVPANYQGGEVLEFLIPVTFDLK